MEFILRPWTITDLDSLINFANNFKIAKYMTDAFPHPYTLENGKAFIEFAGKNSPVHIFAIEINKQASGGIGIHPQADIQRRNAELGYWLAEPFWGNGIITKAVRQMTEYGFKTFDIDRIFARPFGTNLASQRVLEKAGFILEARLTNTLFKNGEYEDELITKAVALLH
jgi:RimJ/RimL family protein N-acetyltransferase